MDGDYWKIAALRLARAIMRFQNNSWAHVHKQGTVSFAYHLIKQTKKK